MLCQIAGNDIGAGLVELEADVKVVHEAVIRRGRLAPGLLQRVRRYERLPRVRRRRVVRDLEHDRREVSKGGNTLLFTEQDDVNVFHDGRKIDFRNAYYAGEMPIVAHVTTVDCYDGIRKSNTLPPGRDIEDLYKGKGKHTGRMGALVCRLRSGKTFKVGTGFSDAEREAPPARHEPIHAH